MDEFKQDILKSLEFASHSDKLLTLGIKPSYPETGYGYIQVSEEKKKIFTNASYMLNTAIGLIVFFVAGVAVLIFREKCLTVL